MKVTIETLAAIYNIGMSIVMGDGDLKPESVVPLEKFYGRLRMAILPVHCFRKRRMRLLPLSIRRTRL